MVILAAGVLSNSQVVLLVMLVLAVMFLIMRLTNRRLQNLRRQAAEWKNELAQSSPKTRSDDSMVTSDRGGSGGTTTTATTTSSLNRAFVELHDFSREVEGRLDDREGVGITT